MTGLLVDMFEREAESADEPLTKEAILIRCQRFIVLARTVINNNPTPGEVYAELHLVKPRGYISYAADEIFERKAKTLTGIPWLDDATVAQPVYRYKLRPDRELNQGGVERKTQEKSPCCKRTLNYVAQGPGRAPKRFCRKCDQEVL